MANELTDSDRAKILRKVYIGDGVYARFDGYGFEVTTEDGVRITNIVYLEPEVFTALSKFVERTYDYIERTYDNRARL